MAQVILLFVSLCPLIMTFSTTELFEFPKIIWLYTGANTLLALWAFEIAKQGRTSLPSLSGLTKILLLFSLSSLLSTWWALDRNTALFGYYTRFSDGLFAFITFLMFFYAIVTHLDKKQVLISLKAILITTTLVSGYALLQKLGIDSHIWKQSAAERVFSTLGQPNWLAQFLSVLIPLQIAFLLQERKMILKIALALSLASSILATICTLSATGLAGLALALGLFFTFKTKKKTTFMGVVILALLITGVIISSQKIQNRTQETGRIRGIVWQGSLETFRKASPERKLFGYGLGNFAYAFLPQRPAALNQTAEWDLLFNKPHNEYLDILINQGIIGLSLFLVLVVFQAKSFSLKRDNPNYVTNIALFSGWFPLLVTNFFGFFVTPTRLLFWLLPAFAIVINKTNQPHQHERGDRRLSLVSILALLMAIFLYQQIFCLYFADVDYTKANQFRAMGRFRESFVYFEEAIKYNPRIPHYHRDYAVSLVQLAAMETKKENLLEKGREEVERALQLNPGNSITLRSALQTYQQMGNIDAKYRKRGIEIANQAVTTIPTDATLQVLKAKLLWENGNHRLGLEAMEKAVSLKPDHPEALLLIKDYNKIMGL